MPHEQVREDNIRDVLSAAIKIFSEYGVDGTTFAQVAKHAGVSLRSVYRYFENKDALVSATVESAVLKLEDEVRHSVASKAYLSLTGSGRVMFLCRKILNLARDNCKIQVALNEAESYLTRLQVRDIFCLYKNSDNIIIEYFMDAFRAGVLDGTINEQIECNHQYFTTLAVTFRGFYNRIATIYANEEMTAHYAPAELIEEFLDSIEKSISTEWVRKPINNKRKGSDGNG